MSNSGRRFFSVTLFIVPLFSFFLISYCDESNSEASKEEKIFSTNSLSDKTLFDEDSSSNDGQESTNFFTSDLGAPFDSSSDYGSLFDNFPGLPYFPDFGEIFRITTPEPPFTFPEYVKDSFPESRRRRFPRPASSGTRTKVSKQNQSEPREKPVKSKPPSKSKDYPKIFRFTSDRVNLADFDTKKKMNENYLTLHKGDELDSDKVKRNKFLILHGGVFEIERNGRLSLITSDNG